MEPRTIKKVRTVLGWSQEAFARHLRVSLQTVWRWETGRASPTGLSLDALEALIASNGLRVTPSGNVRKK
jgi:putative transcriptional regulator